MGFETLPHNDYLATLDHLANVGPISTSVAAGDWGMYFGGVFDGCDYESNVNVNHAVQLVIYIKILQTATFSAKTKRSALNLDTPV